MAESPVSPLANITRSTGGQYICCNAKNAYIIDEVVILPQVYCPITVLPGFLLQYPTTLSRGTERHGAARSGTERHGAARSCTDVNILVKLNRSEAQSLDIHLMGVLHSANRLKPPLEFAFLVFGSVRPK